MATRKFPVLRYKQNETLYLSLVLPFSVLDDASEVKVYAIDVDGYQRQPNPMHYNKIKNAALNKVGKFRLPTAIVLGGNKSTIEKYLLQDSNDSWSINIPEGEKIFRIVDGQHRVFGLREATKKDENYNNYELSAIVLLTPEDEKSIELEVFTDINSKSKRINTDLAELAKFDYQIKEKKIPKGGINKHIAIKTAYHLKTDYKDGVWHYGIKFDIHSENTLGIIGISIFSESIEKIIERYIFEHPKFSDLEGDDLIDYCSDASKILSHFITDIWDNVIRLKWGGAFKEDIVRNEEGEIVKIYFDKSYYIQKGLGIKSLNPLIGDIVIDNGFNDEAVNLIKNVILGSKIKISDWQNGGRFAGFNSESGFKKIKEAIKGNGLNLFL